MCLLRYFDIMKKGSSYNHIFKYTALFGGVQGLNILISLVRNKFIAIILGPIGVGLISIYNTALTLLQNSTNFGLQMSGVREISQAFDAQDFERTEYYISMLRSWCLIVAMLGFAVCLALSSPLSLWAFSSNEHTIHFALLSIVVAMTAIAGGETAILKATRRLKQLAKTSVGGVVVALIISVPLYIKWSYGGIVPSLILISFSQMVLVMWYSYRYYPIHLMTKWQSLKEGKAMITVGMAFVIAGVLGSGAEFIVRAYLGDMSVSLAGLYNAGYMITMTYAGMVFAAMETDYYPHLSAVCDDTKKMNGAANKQIEVSLIIIAPMLVALMFSVNILIPLLFSGKFMPVVGMTQIAVIAMYFRAINLPVAYIMLAKGDSKSYLMLEAVYDILIVVCIIFGYTNWGLDGTGIALATASFVDTTCVLFYCSWKYDFEMSERLFKNFVLQLMIGLVALAVVKLSGAFIYWSTGLMLFGLSLYISLRMYKNIGQ